MKCKVKFTEQEKKVLRDEYQYARVRFIVFDTHCVKCYSENSKLLYEATFGRMYEIAKKLPANEVIALTDIINS